MSLIPFLWLIWQKATSQIIGDDTWWIAGVFGVSWLADTAAHWLPADVVGNAYPLAQAALIGAVLLRATYADWLLAFLIVVALVAVLWKGASGEDVFFRTVAWGAICGMAYTTKDLGRFRTMLLWSFGVGWLAWLPYAAMPNWGTWIAFQIVRAVGILSFCWATLGPTLRLVDA